MLIKEVVQGYGGRVEFVSENWGDSKLADRYGVKKYPAVFVDDILIAGPNDFGWFGATGKYTPWRQQANHEKFKSDLAAMIELILKGKKADAARGRSSTVEVAEISQIPLLETSDLDGHKINSAGLAGQVVIVELWATWCPPCRTILSWMGEIKSRYGEKVTILAVAVESEEADVRKLTASIQPSVKIVMGSEALVSSFGTLGSIPRIFVFDREGKTAGIFYGAPPDLHERVTRVIDAIAK